MINKKTYKTITWLDVDNPSTDEIRHLINDYSINPSIAGELALPTYKSRAILKDNSIFVVLHFPAIRHSHKENHTKQEIDFIISKDLIITNRYDSIDALEGFSKIFEVNSILEKDTMEDNAGYVFYYMMKEMYKSLNDELDTIHDSLKSIEDKIFAGKEKEMVSEISNTSRDLLSFQRTLSYHKDVLENFQEICTNIFDAEYSDNFSKIIDEFYRLERVTAEQTDFLRELRETNNSLLSTKQNEIMKTLTILTFLALPFTVITGFFQMNTANTPFIGSDNAWGAIVSTEILVVIILFIIARKKKWL